MKKFYFILKSFCLKLKPIFLISIIIFISISCEKDANFKEGICTLNKILVENKYFQESGQIEFKYDDNFNLISIEGYPLSDVHSSEEDKYSYTYDDFSNLTKIRSNFVIYDDFTFWTNHTYIYNNEKNITQRIDTIRTNDYSTSRKYLKIYNLYYSSSQDEISIKVQYRYNTASVFEEFDNDPSTGSYYYFIINKIDDNNIQLKKLDGDSTLIEQQLINVVYDDKKNPFYNSSIPFNELNYVFENTYPFIYQIKRLPNTGLHNIVLIRNITQETEFKADYSYNSYNYPTTVNSDDFKFDYIYNCR